MSEVTVYSATKLPDSTRGLVESYAKAHFSSSTLSFQLDSSLIAGIRLVGAGRQIELSLADLLDNLVQSL